MKTTFRTLTTYSLLRLDCYGNNWRKTCGLLLPFSIVMSFLSGALIYTCWIPPVEASSHRVKLLEIPVPTGSIPKTLIFPLYEQNKIQYFSAGLGKEERSLTYPAFPLKLIFVQGERAYLAGVSIHLADEDGTLRLKIPGAEVEGPWLFINISPGTYMVSGTHSTGITIKKTITVSADQSTMTHFRFP